MPAFTFLNRGYDQTLVLIPGWATDEQIFASWLLPFNLVHCPVVQPATFAAACADFLCQQKLAEVTVLGFSLGGFLALNLQKKYADLIKKTYLVGMRPQYAEGDLAVVAGHLRQAKEAYLRRFYRCCFSAEEVYRVFKQQLEQKYLKQFSLTQLLTTLEYFKEMAVTAQLINEHQNIRFLHGEMDQIAPLAEVQALVPAAQLTILPAVGHMPFYHKELKYSLSKRFGKDD